MRCFPQNIEINSIPNFHLMNDFTSEIFNNQVFVSKCILSLVYVLVIKLHLIAVYTSVCIYW